MPDNVLVGSPECVLEVAVNGLPVYVIGIEDLILDRVEGCAATNSGSDFDWAVNLAAARYETRDTGYLLAEAERRQVRPAAEQALAELWRRLEALRSLGFGSGR